MSIVTVVVTVVRLAGPGASAPPTACSCLEPWAAVLVYAKLQIETI